MFYKPLLTRRPRARGHASASKGFFATTRSRAVWIWVNALWAGLGSAAAKHKLYARDSIPLGAFFENRDARRGHWNKTEGLTASCHA